MNARQRRKLVRKHKDLIAHYKVMRRLRGLSPLGPGWSDLQLARHAAWLLVSVDEWSTKRETPQ